MANHATARSQWLPGLDPDTSEFPDLFKDQHVTASCSSSPPAAELPLPLATVESPAEVSQPRSGITWRSSANSSEDIPRVLWPILKAEEFGNFGGSVAKFEANLAAINLVRQIEATHRSLSSDECVVLQRFTGWGGLPASFNLEGDDVRWVARARKLRELLSDGEYESARASINNSHYTEVFVIEAVWRAIERFGFVGGRVLEPSAGVGHFVGAMPRAIAEQSSVTAVEIDHLPGRMLKALYAPGGVDVRIAPFEKTPLADNWFDLAISNVPFGKYKVADLSNRPYCRFSIHNYFFGRALDLVRPGGLVCFITTSYTLDGWTDEARRYIASQAHFLGAIRLPRGAFAGIASTDVQTDIVFLRKRDRAEDVNTDWLGLEVVPDELRHPQCYDRHLQVSAWYAKHPEFCIGKIARESNGYEAVPTAVFEGDLEAALKDCVERLPTGVYRPRATTKGATRESLSLLFQARGQAASESIEGACIALKATRWSIFMTR